MKRYESRFCTFGVPDSWEPQPPFGFVEPGDLEELHSAQALELWQETAITAEAYATEEKETLPHLLEGFEIQGEGPAVRPRGELGQAYFLSYRYLNEDREPVLVRKTYLTHGPLSVQLEVSRPEEEDTPKKAELTEQISTTLALRDAAFLGSHRPLSLFAAAASASSSASATSGATANSRPPELLDERRELRRCCVSVPLLEGWSFQEEANGDGLYTRGASSIRLHRPVGIENDAADWFGERMEALQGSRSRLLGSQQGEHGEAPFAAVLFELPGDERQWNRSAAPRRLDLFSEARQPLVLSLVASVSEMDRQISLLEALVEDTRFLDPELWQTVLAEPWIEHTLEGPWTCEGPGIYFHVDRKLIVQAGSDTNRVPLANIQDSILESVKSNVDTDQPFEDDAVPVKWQGADALSYSVDGRNTSGEPLSLRTFWTSRDQHLYSAVVLGPDSGATKQEFDPLIRGIRFEEGRRR